MFQAKYPGTCSLCGNKFEAGTMLVANGTVQRADKVVRAFRHANDCRTYQSVTLRDLENLADSLASTLLVFEENGTELETGVGAAVEKATVKQLGPVYAQAWELFELENEGWDGETWPRLNGLVRFLMNAVGRWDPKLQSETFNRRWAEYKNEFAAQEREQEAAAFLAGL